MRLEYTDGCVCTSLQVDGKEFNIDLSFQERLDVAKKLLEACNESRVFEEVYLLNSTDEVEALKEFSKLDLPEQKEKALAILMSEDSWDRDYLTQAIFIKFLESVGEYEHLGDCDCCGDSIIKYSITL